MRTSRLILWIDRREICYLQWMVESYDGMASMRTVNPADGEVEITIAPGCKEDVYSLIDNLIQEGSIHVKNERPIE